MPCDRPRPSRLRRRLDRRPALLGARGGGRRERGDRAHRAGRRADRRTSDPTGLGGPGRRARVRRLGWPRARRQARSSEGRAAHAPGAGSVHDHDALRRAAGIGTRQLRRHGCSARRRPSPGPRGAGDRPRDRGAGVVSRDRRGEDPRRQAGSVRRGPRWFSATHLPRSRRRGRAHHPRSRVRDGPRASHGTVLHRPVARFGCHHRARDGRVRAGGSAGHGRVASNEGRGHRDGGGAARGRRCPCCDAAFAQLDASAGARSGDAHARNGPARERLDGRRGARREGSGGRGGRLDVLRHRGRSRAGHRRGTRRRRDGPPGAVGARRGPRMVTAEERAAPLLARLPPIPETKALLSIDGGICPDDGAAFVFDPWNPTAHRCPRCGKTFTGERHDRHWARYQHLWLAERAAHLATLAALGGDARAADRAHEILQAYAQCYFRYPNRDNVLGPSRLFFSTYLESIWIGNYVAAAVLLRASGKLDDATAQEVSRVADEAANLIGEFDEGFSNRQTWNNAALAAIAVWFEDEDLAKRAIEGPTGLLEHLLRGFGRDGMWYEGENYHLFALRCLLTGAGWARLAGVSIFAEPQLAARVRAALLAPACTALPDFTFPARKDSRFGLSLAQPAYLELSEIGLARLAMPDVTSWLHALYDAP